jgi:dienelactone hydrolase
MGSPLFSKGKTLVNRFFTVTLCLLFTGLAHGSASSTFRFAGKPGPYSVGFRVAYQYDNSRSYEAMANVDGKLTKRDGVRPMQTLIWYPAQHGSGSQISYGDYLNLFTSEDSFSLTPSEAADVLRKDLQDYRADADPSAMMWARKDAKPENSKFPLVVYAPSYSGPGFENADVCEYLASYGYVVIASPSIGSHSFDMNGGMEGAETQARDISFEIGFASTIPQVDSAQVAVLGYSWGGISNFFAAASDDRIKALIAFDGSARYFPSLISKSDYVRPKVMTIPLLFFTRGEIPLEDLVGADLSGNVLDEMIHSDVYIVRMHDMRHGEFASVHQRSPAYWDRHPPGEYSPEETAESYDWVARYTLEFLNWTFRQDARAHEFLTAAPAKNGVPDHMLAVDFRPKKETEVPAKP